MVFNLYLLHLEGNIHNENALITIDGEKPEPRFKGCLNKLHAMFYETFESDYEKL